MVGFIFGGNSGIATPEDLAQRRRAVEGLMRGSTEEMPNTIGKGIAAIAKALSGRWGHNALAREEEKGRASAQADYKPITEAVANSTMPTGEQLDAALANPWASDGQRMIVQELLKRRTSGSPN